MRPTPEQARAALLVSICMTVLGTCGVGSGVAGATQTSLPARPGMSVEGESSPEFHVIEALWESPYRRQLAAANAIVSGMLLVGSFLLTFRRPSALWWIRNAIAANLLWIVANFAHTASCLLRAGPELYAGMEAYARERLGADVAVDGREVVVQVVVAVGIGALLSAAVHLGLAFRAHRPDIRAFIESGD